METSDPLFGLKRLLVVAGEECGTQAIEGILDGSAKNNQITISYSITQLVQEVWRDLSQNDVVAHCATCDVPIDAVPIESVTMGDLSPQLQNLVISAFETAEMRAKVQHLVTTDRQAVAAERSDLGIRFPHSDYVTYWRRRVINVMRQGGHLYTTEALINRRTRDVAGTSLETVSALRGQRFHETRFAILRAQMGVEAVARLFFVASPDDWGQLIRGTMCETERTTTRMQRHGLPEETVPGQYDTENRQYAYLHHRLRLVETNARIGELWGGRDL